MQQKGLLKDEELGVVPDVYSKQVYSICVENVTN